jgi:hypothetical protein
MLESPSIHRSLLLPSNPTTNSLLSLLCQCIKHQKNNPAEVVLGESPNPSLQEKGPLGCKNNYHFFPSASYFFPYLPLPYTHFGLASKSRGTGWVQPQLCATGTPVVYMHPHFRRPVLDDLFVLSSSTFRVSCLQQGISILLNKQTNKKTRFRHLHSQSLSLPYLLINNTHCFLLNFAS